MIKLTHGEIKPTSPVQVLQVSKFKLSDDGCSSNELLSFFLTL